jgi:uncharacterized membrane protein
VPSEHHGDAERTRVRTTRLEAFSDGVFAIATTLLVLDLATGASGSAWERVVDGWPCTGWCCWRCGCS